MFDCAAGVKLKLHVNGVAVLLVAFQTQDAGGPLDVSLNTIVNGATPAHPCDELLVAFEMFLEVKDATGADETLIHVTCVEMLEPYAFVAFSFIV